jgi:hypothetical protein
MVARLVGGGRAASLDAVRTSGVILCAAQLLASCHRTTSKSLPSVRSPPAISTAVAQALDNAPARCPPLAWAEHPVLVAQIDRAVRTLARESTEVGPRDLCPLQIEKLTLLDGDRAALELLVRARGRNITVSSDLHLVPKAPSETWDTSDLKASVHSFLLAQATAEWLREHPEVVEFTSVEMLDGYVRTRMRTAEDSTMCVRWLGRDTKNTRAWCWKGHRAAAHFSSRDWGFLAPANADATSPPSVVGFVGLAPDGGNMSAWAVRFPAAEWVRVASGSPPPTASPVPSWYPHTASPTPARLMTAVRPKTGWTPMATTPEPNVGPLDSWRAALVTPQTEGLSAMEMSDQRFRFTCARWEGQWTCTSPVKNDLYELPSNYQELAYVVPSRRGMPSIVFQRSTYGGGSGFEAHLEVYRRADGQLSLAASLLVGAAATEKELTPKGAKRPDGRLIVQAYYHPHRAAGVDCIRVEKPKSEWSETDRLFNRLRLLGKTWDQEGEDPEPLKVVDQAGLWQITLPDRLERISTDPERSCPLAPTL